MQDVANGAGRLSKGFEMLQNDFGSQETTFQSNCGPFFKNSRNVFEFVSDGYLLNYF